MRSFISQEKKKILIVGPMPPNVGGITTFITTMLESDLVREYRFILFDTSRPILKDRTPSVRDLRIIYYLNPLGLLKSTSVTLYHLLLFPVVLLMTRPHIVHIHTASYWVFWENSLYLLTSKVLGAKVILHIHGGAFDEFYNNENILVKDLIRVTMSFPEKIVVLSSYWKSFLAEIVGIKERVTIINNGVISSKYLPQHTQDNKNEVKVLFIGGTDARRKGIYTLAKAIPLVVEEFSSITFTFIGKSEIENIQKLFREVKIEEYVRILGQVSEEEKIRHLRSADIFVLPTYSEGLPITILEAMAAGLPIISTPVGAIPEVIEEGKNGFLVQVGNYEALAEKMLILAKDRRMRQKMRKNNLEKIVKQYDQSIIMSKLDNEYSELLEEHILCS